MSRLEKLLAVLAFSAAAFLSSPSPLANQPANPSGHFLVKRTRNTPCLEIMALKNDSYRLISQDFSGQTRPWPALYRFNSGKTLRPREKVCLPLSPLSLGKEDLSYQSFRLDKENSSLWSLAEEYTQAKDKSDLLRNIRLLKRLNHLANVNALPSGKEIRIPYSLLHQKYSRPLSSSGKKTPVHAPPLWDEKTEINSTFSVEGYSRRPAPAYFYSLEGRLRHHGLWEKQLQPRKINMIVVHTTEHGPGEWRNTLAEIIRGKKAHYLISPSGESYAIVKEEDRALGSGQSLWNGLYGVDYQALNIEVFANEVGPGQGISDQQYLSLRKLIFHLQNKYRLGIERVLGHNQVAINYQTNERQRKADPGPDFDWKKIGHSQRYLLLDPDILSGLAKNSYDKKRILPGQRMAEDYRQGKKLTLNYPK